jgi:multimeric flavodoxin WrbA
MPVLVAAVCEGASSDGLDEVVVHPVAALELTSADVLAAAGYILATPANLGYMSGALKHAFDTTYSDVLGLTRGRPFGVVIHGESDTAGALVGVEKVTTGLQWRLVAAPVESIGVVGDLEIAACVELGAVVAASTLDL